MRAVTIILLVARLCLGVEISGIWGLKHPDKAGPLAIQIEQTGDQLVVLMIMASPGGK
jgi:hypothetical protein